MQFLDQVTRSPLQKTQFSDQLAPVGTKSPVKEDLLVNNADANSFKLALCHLIIVVFFEL